VEIDDPTWHGYLANIEPAVFRSPLRRTAAERMRGAEFLVRYGGTTDPVTRVEPERQFALYAATAHPVHEHARIRRFVELLAQGPDDARNERLGELMYASHASHGRCGLGSPGTDRLVALVRASGQAAGLYGARITSGGSGGTVAVLGARHAAAAVSAVAEGYAKEAGIEPLVFSGSSPGSAAFGYIHLKH
jgi:L-arabinokinase